MEELLFNDDNKSGGNKLRTYRKLKTQFDLENYVCADVNKKSISTFVKIRISNSNLNIEKGRYLNTSAEDRICKLCNMFKITVLSWRIFQGYLWCCAFIY